MSEQDLPSFDELLGLARLVALDGGDGPVIWKALCLAVRVPLTFQTGEMRGNPAYQLIDRVWLALWAQKAVKTAYNPVERAQGTKR